MPIYHLTNRALWPLKPLERRDACAYLWHKLSARFPNCLAAALMPNHVHVVYETSRPNQGRYELAIELRAFTRAFFPGTEVWEKIPRPQHLATPIHILRQIRYVHLNPCRDSLVTDPLEWEWTTHRDALGAIASPWPDLTRLHQLYKTKPPHFERAFHAYVSGDPTVQIAGTPPPKQPGTALAAPLEVIGRAALLALRAPAADLGPGTRSQARRLAVRLALRLGCGDYDAIERAFHITRWGITLIAQGPPHPGEWAALRTLADPRLLRLSGT